MSWAKYKRLSSSKDLSIFRRGTTAFDGGGGGAPNDPDAQAYIDALGTAGYTVSGAEETAINTFVLALKADGIWAKSHAIYPFIGGTAATHKFNLVDTSLYQVTWYGGVTHNSDGIKGNGTNGYGDTNLPNNTMGQNDQHFSIYSRTNTSVNGVDIAAWNLSFGSGLYSRTSSLNFNLASNTNVQVIEPVADSLGFYLGTRTTSSQVIMQKNTTQYTKSSNTLNLVTTTWKILRPGEYSGEYSPRNLSFASIGDGLTATEAADLYTAVQALQTALNREV